MKKVTLISTLIALGFAWQLPSAYACPNQANDDESVNISIKPLNDTEDYTVIRNNCQSKKQARHSPKPRLHTSKKMTVENKAIKHPG